MKIILENKITSVTASSEDSSYPDDNVLDEHPKRVWKGDGVDSATLSCSVSGPVDTIAIFNTNAESISITISDPNEVIWPEDTWDGLVWVETIIPVTVEMQSQANNSAVWGSLTAVSIPVNIDVSLATATGTVIQAGVVVMGLDTVFKNPHYGLAQGLIDYSVSATLANGASYYNQLDIVRTFSGQIIPERDTEFYSFMHDFARTYGLSPKAWRITDIDNFEWVCYARFVDMPQGSHDFPSHSPISFNLIEVI